LTWGHHARQGLGEDSRRRVCVCGPPDTTARDYADRVSFIDLYPPRLNTEGSPEDLRGVDLVVYRLVLTRLAIPGLPPMVKVGDVEIHFTIGPIRTQVTESRQRPGLPFVFDKHMRRAVSVGENELLTVCHMRRSLPEDVGSAVHDWRVRTEAAIGLLAATLDERIARRQLTEDLIFMRGGKAVAAADVHPRVARTCLSMSRTPIETRLKACAIRTSRLTEMQRGLPTST